MKNKVQLITYPNSLGSGLRDLSDIMKSHLKPYIGGVHILPFYPSGADRGFSPIEYSVDSVYGSWEDVDRIGKEFDLMIDFIPNHISSKSHYFQDFVQKGRHSKYADMFIDMDSFGLNAEDLHHALSLVYRRKPREPLIDVVCANAEPHRLWCTFGEDQVDLNFFSPVTQSLMDKWLKLLCSHNVACIRLDALAYVAKKMGTDCFFVEPEIWDILKWFCLKTTPQGIELLSEVHEHHQYQAKLSEKDYLVYDFALPALLLYTIYHKDSQYLLQWLKIRPQKCITTLDTHDGLGIADVSELMPKPAIDLMVASIYEQGLDVGPEYSSQKYHNLDIYQINTTYFAALGGNADAYVIARAIQFFIPGIPQVYYVGLLAGLNDLERVRQTREGRDINRHSFSKDEVVVILETDKTVERLLHLMQIRNETDTFNGTFSLIQNIFKDQIEMQWQKEESVITLSVDFSELIGQISYKNNGRVTHTFRI
jgi:sucrose phosphorylase